MSKKVRQEEDDSYRNDVFESDSDDNDAELENVHDKVESNPSETGTYTVDKDDDSQTSPQVSDNIPHILKYGWQHIFKIMLKWISCHMSHFVWI